jgi:hypothetical protein
MLKIKRNFQAKERENLKARTWEMAQNCVILYYKEGIKNKTAFLLQS